MAKRVTTSTQVAEKAGCNKGCNQPPPSGCLYLHSKSRRWMYKFRPPGHEKYIVRPCIPAGQKYSTRDRGVALAIARRIWKLYAKGNVPAPKGIRQLIDEFQQANKLQASDDQARRNANRCTRYVNKAGISHAYEITEANIETYLAGLRKSRQTALHHKHALSRFCQWLSRQGHLEGNFAAGIPLAAADKIPPEALTPEQETLLLVAARPAGLFPEVAFALGMGLRLEELQVATWNSVDTGTYLSPKTRNYRHLPMTALGAQAIAALKRGKPEDRLFRRRTRKHWCRQLHKVASGLPWWPWRGKGSGRLWHLLRATFACRCAAEGKDPWETMQLMGHTTMGTTMRYVNLGRAMSRRGPG
jgi:integrase